MAPSYGVPVIGGAKPAPALHGGAVISKVRAGTTVMSSSPPATVRTELPASDGWASSPMASSEEGVAFWRTTLDGRWLIDISPSVERMLGYPRWRWFERNFWIEQVYSADRRWVMEQVTANGGGGCPFEMHYRMVNASGEAVWVRESVHVEDGRAICGVMRVDSREGSLLEEVRTTKARLHEAMSRHFRLREDVSRRLASEIHDDLGQFLTVSIRDAELMRCELEPAGRMLPGSVRPRLDRIEQHLRQTLDRLRLMASTLRPPALDEGFAAALGHHVRMVSDATGLRIHVDVDADAFPEQGVEIQVFRIVQEAISNIIRHSEATEVEITLKAYREGSILRVTDNGRGFDPSRIESGIGLATIRERVELIGGHFIMESGPNLGAVLKALFPPRTLAPAVR